MPEGTLHIVSTPIGNLQDITLRALDVFRTVDEILCEDTRHSSRLLSHHGIQVRTSPYHDHNKERRTPELVSRLKNGESFALICDAGTPGVSDEAFFLVRACRREGVPVTTAPGASAMLSALVASGLPTDRFAFEGFVPRKHGERQRKLAGLAQEDRTLIFYCSPYQVRGMCEDLALVLPEVRVVLARELTKLHEEYLVGTATELLARLPKEPKGEFVVLFHPQGKG
ncbi:MAG TPA: 16S rRNA (cytidine(1402)-2'-O)-methyltransferase [Fibrobacteria bacterium]|nr:16S rRNA (cytidine(1402)-2'-O)-methyltransferase [Fibrobacteria bacterium]